MNWKRFFMALVVVFLGAMILGKLIHRFLLVPDYRNYKSLFRAPEDMQSKMPYLWIGYLGYALGFVWIYAKGMEAGKSWLGQGLRYGVAVWVMLVTFGWFVTYAIQPIGRRLVAKALVYELIGQMLLGALVAGVYRREAGASKAAGTD